MNKEEITQRIECLHKLLLFDKLKDEEAIELSRIEKEYGGLLMKEREDKEAIQREKSKDMRNRRRRGKYGEKRVAKELGGRRDGGIGRKDVVQGMFSYEVKTLKQIPASIIKLMEQAERLKKRDTIAVGVYRCNSPRREFFVIERQDWLNLHGK